MTTITAQRRIIAPVATSPARRALLTGFGATLVVGFAVLAGTAFAVGAMASGTVMPGVTVGGIELGGLDDAAAGERLSDALPSLSAGEAVVVVDGHRSRVGYGELGRRHDVAAMVEAAMGVGRASNPIADGIASLRTLVHATSLPLVVHPYDADALAAEAAAIAERFSVDPVDARVQRSGTTFTASAAMDGRLLESEAVAAALGAAVDTTSPDDVVVSLATVPVPPTIDTAEAEAGAAAATSTALALDLEVAGTTDEEEPLAFSADTIAGWLSFREADGALSLVVDEAAAAAAVEALVETVDREPVNAQIGVAPGGGLGGIVPGADGRSMDATASTRALLAALDRRAAGATVASVPLAVEVTTPAFTTAQAEALLPQMSMVSSWTTYYVPGEGNGWGNNINIGAWDIDGRNLYPGEWFSFWESIGPVTEDRGYMYGGAIINGRSTQGVAIGGGICSTSTTIFNAALRAGLEMGVRLNHFYYIDRYPDGLDATVSIMDGWTQDMTFRNDTEHPIVIRGFGGTGSVTFQIWSAPLNRTVVITDPITSNHRRASDTTVVDSSMAPGTSRRVEYPHDGHDVSRSRLVYDAAGNLIHRNDYFSSYATVNGIVAVGPRPAAAEPDPPAEEEEEGA